MSSEVAYESVSLLNEVTNCPKNDSHTHGFVAFKNLNLESLPEAIRSEENLNRLKYLGNTVVKLTVAKSDGTSIYGSGVVYKVTDKYTILTNDHVVCSNDDVKNCTIQFFYDDDNVAEPEVISQGEALKGGSQIQDRCFFTFDPVPQRIIDLNLFDNTALMARVKLTYFDDTSSSHMAFPSATAAGCLLLVNRSEYDPEKEIRSCEAFIEDHQGHVYNLAYLGVGHMDEKVVYLKIESLPEMLMGHLAETVVSLPGGAASSSRTSMIPVTITHPHGGIKMVTFGNVMDVIEQGLVKKLLHTAPTCPGSSGGLVVIVPRSSEAASNLGFASNVCCHCEGDRADEYNGIPTETGNINIALFNS